ncbi:MAG TPA: hypothetical protein VI076_14830 [Actinopolymorphaceae bacterium]
MHAVLAQVQEQAQEHAGSPSIPPELIGLGAFALLVFLLIVTLAIGKGRPHA